MRSNHRPWLVGWLAIGSMVVKLLFTFCELHKKKTMLEDVRRIFLRRWWGTTEDFVTSARQVVDFDDRGCENCL